MKNEGLLQSPLQIYLHKEYRED